jgi:hypothetical protein
MNKEEQDETKRDETKRDETKRDETKRDETKQDEKEVKQEVYEEDNPDKRVIVKTKVPKFNYRQFKYYNMIIDNPIQRLGPGDEVDRLNVMRPAILNITNSDPILDKPNEYELSVVRFKIPSSIPLFIFDTRDLDPTVFQIQLTFTYYEGLDVTYFYVNRTIEFKNFNGSNYPYTYGINYIQHFLIIVNDAIDDAGVQLRDEIRQEGIPVPDFNVPKFKYNTESDLLVLEIDKVFQNNEFRLRMSKPLHSTFFQTLPVRINDVIDVRFRPIIQFLPVLFIPTRLDDATQTEDPFIRITSEFPIGALFNQIKEIIFESDTIPVGAEYIQSSNNQQRRIVSDFTPEQDIGSRQYYTYSPPIYRFYDLLASDPMYNMDIQIFISYTTGEVFPLYLQPGEVATIKFMFKKKVIGKDALERVAPL